MDENTISAVMRRLVEKDWVSWGMDCFGFAYRLFATESGTALLDETRGPIVVLAHRIWGCARPVEPTSFAP